MTEPGTPFQLWQEARASGDPEWTWRRLMVANGHLRGLVNDAVLIHRVLAQHGIGETCLECPCHHCGTSVDDADGDHSCPCPYSDQDCPWHSNPAPEGTEQ